MRPDELEPMSSAMKSLLDSERPLDVVPAATRSKLFAKVSASMAGAAVAGSVGSAALGGKAVASTAAAGTTAVTAKVLVVAAVAFSVGGGVGAGVHAVVAPQPAPMQPAPIVIRVEAPPAPPPPVVIEEPAQVPAPPPARAPPTPKKPDNLGAERSYIEQARAALSRHEAAAALSALAQHEREYPAGQLAEERSALQVIALNESGETAKARELAAKFRAKYPGSLLMPAVDAAAPP